MTDFTIATFNVKNLIGPGKEYYQFEEYTDEEYAWKEAWMAEQLVTLDADIIAFQEIFEEDAIRNVMNAADKIGGASNDTVLPDHSKSYHKKAIFRKLAYAPYTDAALAFAPNINDGEPGKRRPGLAIISRLGFVGEPEIIQDLDPPFEMPFRDFDKGAAGGITISRLSRPILKVRIAIKGTVVTVFNVHLKSKLGEHITPEGADFPPEADLINYDPVGRAMGAVRAGLRRMAEAWVLRREVLAELEQGNPVIVLGDLNDGEHAVSSEIITGEAPFRNYSWMRHHDAKSRNERYKKGDAEIIRKAVEAVKLHSAEAMFVRKSLRDLVYTSAFGGVFQSIDQILLSQHFHPENPTKIADMLYFSTLNDHITDGSHPEAPYNKLASDHGQIMAHFRMTGQK